MPPVNSGNRVPRPELLAPAGDWDCARAAVANGADAVYFGLPRFNARMRAENFTDADLPALSDFLHAHGVKAYCALNVLIFTAELADAAEQLRALARAGIDAVIIQDVGLAALSRTLAPSLRVHASTQMSITSPEGIRFAAALGASRAVLARELSLREFEKFGAEMPLEVFVHGALCVAYSGQCLTSESLGQRSANRGECAQACRMPYRLVVDGSLRDLGDKRYLLSPQDLAAVEEVPRLVELGIASFKIEGRLKSPEYVAAVTRVYRKAIDAALGTRAAKPDAADRYSLEMTFSRGLFGGWLHGVDHQNLVGATFGKKRGVYLGRVSETFRDGFFLEHATNHPPVKPGDGLAFENPADTDGEQGGSAIAVNPSGNLTEIRTHRGKINYALIGPGTRVWKTADPALEKELRATFTARIERSSAKRPLPLLVSGSSGSPLVVSGGGGRVESSLPLVPATKLPLDASAISEIFGRLGETAFELGGIDWRVEGPVFLPRSELGKMKASLLSLIGAAERSSREPPEISMESALARLGLPDLLGTPAGEPALSVLVRTDDHLDAALESDAARIYVDFEDLRRYSGAVEKVRAAGQKEIFLATPRIQKAGEAGVFKLIGKCAPDGILVRNPGAIEFFSNEGTRMAGDFSLNVANPASAAVFRGLGLETLTVSYDLDIAQVLALARACPPAWLELTLHQHMPMFHMEHCVFAAFMSDGKSFLDCGRPCEKHRVHLRDRVGIDHPLRADVGCRNTLFNATAQSGAAHFPDLIAAGFRSFRVELLEEDGPQSKRILSDYAALLSDSLSPENLLGRVGADSRLGVTEGTLRPPA